MSKYLCVPIVETMISIAHSQGLLLFILLCLSSSWEYPGDETRGGNGNIDKENLVLLCDELRKNFDDAPEKFELSMAIPASVARFEVGFDFTNLAPSVHFFNVMAYDLHGIWDEPRIVGAHSDIGGINKV